MPNITEPNILDPINELSCTICLEGDELKAKIDRQIAEIEVLRDKRKERRHMEQEHDQERREGFDRRARSSNLKE